MLEPGSEDSRHWVWRGRVYRGLADGNYIFLVQAVALSGMAGPTVRWPFALDATPPTITNITFTDLYAPAWPPGHSLRSRCVRSGWPGDALAWGLPCRRGGVWLSVTRRLLAGVRAQQAEVQVSSPSGRHSQSGLNTFRLPTARS